MDDRDLDRLAAELDRGAILTVEIQRRLVAECQRLRAALASAEGITTKRPGETDAAFVARCREDRRRGTFGA